MNVSVVGSSDALEQAAKQHKAQSAKLNFFITIYLPFLLSLTYCEMLRNNSFRLGVILIKNRRININSEYRYESWVVCV